MQTDSKEIDKIEPKQNGMKTIPWSFLAKVLAGIGAVGGLVLHLMGYISHQVYLATWSVDADLFLKTTDAIIIAGFHTLNLETLTEARENF